MKNKLIEIQNWDKQIKLRRTILMNIFTHRVVQNKLDTFLKVTFLIVGKYNEFVRRHLQTVISLEDVVKAT